MLFRAPLAMRTRGGVSLARSLHSLPPTSPTLTPSALLRSLMRNTAQPVAVLTAPLPPHSSSATHSHGATLSSFTSIALHPVPLVAFSLKLPSRMAEYLHMADGVERLFDVFLLREEGVELAQRFARQLPPSTDPSAVTSQMPTFDPSLFHQINHDPHKSLGVLNCQLVSRIPLTTLGSLSAVGELEKGVAAESELFIARVNGEVTRDWRSGRAAVV